MDVIISEQFKRKATQAVLAILAFILVYLLLMAFALAFTVACVAFGVFIIAAHPMFFTAVLGLGLICTGLLVLVFVFKFAFQHYEMDRSHLTEINRTDAPKLFALIDEIVETVQTDFPKKVYISTEVNAAVFYDANFWSMILPIRKNLQIGMGLVNTVSVSELRAVLAHEFGHFSQRSMKVGSYVYNANRVLHNLLYDNDSYNALGERIANVSNWLSYAVWLAFRIVEGMQWILRKMYHLLNLRYKSLSRQMEFHADAVAANIAGSAPVISSLARLDLASYAFDRTLGFYSDKIKDAIQTGNIYTKQLYILRHLAAEANMPMREHLPLVSLEHTNRFNKSKLNIKDQWASHPSLADRIAQAQALNLPTLTENWASANTLFENVAQIQRNMTERIFDSVHMIQTITMQTDEEFIQDYTEYYDANTFPNVFNCYFDDKNPAILDIQKHIISLGKTSFSQKELYGDAAVDMIYTIQALTRDIETLTNIADGLYADIKSFDYDGVRYDADNMYGLVPKLKNELHQLKLTEEKNDIRIFQHALGEARKNGLANEYIAHYQAYLDMDKRHDALFDTHFEFKKHLTFIEEVLEYDIILTHQIKLAQQEPAFKDRIRTIIADEQLKPAITAIQMDSFTTYLTKDWTYFQGENYNQYNLGILYDALYSYEKVVGRAFFLEKKQLLEFQAQFCTAKIQGATGDC